jgi:hypothetical protein
MKTLKKYGGLVIFSGLLLIMKDSAEEKYQCLRF